MGLWQETKVEPRDRRLLIAFGGGALAIMALGALFALVMLLIRTPALSVLSPDLFYQAVTGHALMMFIFWLGFIQTAFLIAAGTVLARRRLWSYGLAWAGFALMAAAALLALGGVLLGANITYHASVPLAKQYSAAWLVYLSFVVLSLGMLAVVVDLIVTIFGAVERKLSLTSWAAFLDGLPVPVFGAAAGLLIAIPGLIAAIKAFTPAFLWTLGIIPFVDPNAYRLHWHIAFHIYHYMPALTLVGVAYVLAEATTGAKFVYPKQVSKTLFLLYPFFVPPTFVYHLLMDPNLAYNVKFIGTILSLLVGVPTVLNMFIIVGMLEARMRGAGLGLLGWLRRLPWGNPAFGSMAMAMVCLFVGGVLAYVLLQGQLAPLLHNTFAVPAYIHPMAAGGATIMYMGALYYAVPLLADRQLWGLGLARVQPYVMGVALLLMSAFGTGAGLAGVPRRYASFFGDAPASWSVWMNLSLGVGGMLAFLSLAAFILIVAMTALAGKRAVSIEEAIGGTEPLALPEKVEHKRTPVALVPASLFVVSIIVATLLTFGLLWGLPMQLQFR